MKSHGGPEPSQSETQGPDGCHAKRTPDEASERRDRPRDRRRAPDVLIEKIEDTSQFKKVRKDLARLLTEQNVRKQAVVAS